MGRVIDFNEDIKTTTVMINNLTAPTVDADGDSVDMVGFDACTFLVCLGNSGDTLSGSVKVEVEIEESDDDSAFTDVADAELEGYVAGTNDGCMLLVDAPAEDSRHFLATYRGNARYVRPVLNVTGTHTNGIPITIVAFQHGFHGAHPVA